MNHAVHIAILLFYNKTNPCDTPCIFIFLLRRLMLSWFIIRPRYPYLVFFSAKSDLFRGVNKPAYFLRK